MTETSPERLSRGDFSKLAAFIESTVGIKMPPTKVTMVEGRLRKRVRANGLQSMSEYCRFLFDENGLDAEAVHLIDVITTNKTEFFREPEHFRILSDVVLPGLTASRRVDGRTPFKIWSAACSTGAEPYSLAMVTAEFARAHQRFCTSIIATDISTKVLEIAISGIYPEAMADPIPAGIRNRYVMRAKNRARELVRIVPELRSQVRFLRLNLMDATYPVDRDIDAIFCRNILIYFDKPTQEAVVTRLCRHLRPGGFLFLGHSESLAGINLPLAPIGHTVFQYG